MLAPQDRVLEESEILSSYGDGLVGGDVAEEVSTMLLVFRQMLVEVNAGEFGLDGGRSYQMSWWRCSPSWYVRCRA
jgi:hypothetical protein